MERSKSALNITVIGGGLVGSTCACFMAKRGHNVHLYEYREDIRTMEHVQGRSINLAMSARARAALEVIGLEDHMINEHGIPMKARMIHGLDGSQTPIPYDKRTNQCIYSVGRKYLNEILLTAAESYPNLKLNFNHKLVSANLKEGRVTIMQTKTQETFEVTSDLIIGADGAFSAVRKHMMKQPLFDYSQTYIEHGYLELCIPPINNNFAMKHNYLHIWPRGEFMMIALPNQDRSWTVTLFMPFTKFQLLDTPENLIAFFEKYFPDSLPLIGEKKLIDDFFRGTPSPLVSIKCHPYDVGGKAIIIGDAAHAMVPFYGQGMNAGFEDCFLLDQLMEMHNEKLSVVLPAFTKRRTKDAHAICDLAMYNYVEMRDLVNRRGYKLRKMFDDFLFKVMPEKWVPLYNSVTFTNMGYEQCVRNRAWQDNIIMKTAWLVFSLFVMAFALIFFNFKNEPGFSTEPLSNPRFIHLPEHTHYHI